MSQPKYSGAMLADRHIDEWGHGQLTLTRIEAKANETFTAGEWSELGGYFSEHDFFWLYLESLKVESKRCMGNWPVGMEC